MNYIARISGDVICGRGLSEDPGLRIDADL